MRQPWWAAGVLLLAGCGIPPSGVNDAGRAPTGIAPGMTLYFLDSQRHLSPGLRDTGRLGTISDAVTLLLLGPGGSGLSTGITPTDVTRVEATVSNTTIRLRVPVAAGEVTASGIDQIVCTALASHVQSGGSSKATVQILFTLPAAGSDQQRTCPLIG